MRPSLLLLLLSSIGRRAGINRITSIRLILYRRRTLNKSRGWGILVQVQRRRARWSRSFRCVAIARDLLVLDPLDVCASSYESLCRVVAVVEMNNVVRFVLRRLELSGDEDVQHSPQLISLVMRRVLQLRMCEQRVEDAKVGVAQCDGLDG